MEDFASAGALVVLHLAEADWVTWSPSSITTMSKVKGSWHRKTSSLALPINTVVRNKGHFFTPSPSVRTWITPKKKYIWRNDGSVGTEVETQLYLLFCPRSCPCMPSTWCRWLVCHPFLSFHWKLSILGCYRFLWLGLESWFLLFGFASVEFLFLLRGIFLYDICIWRGYRYQRGCKNLSYTVYQILSRWLGKHNHKWVDVI